MRRRPKIWKHVIALNIPFKNLEHELLEQYSFFTSKADIQVPQLVKNGIFTLNRVILLLGYLHLSFQLYFLQKSLDLYLEVNWRYFMSMQCLSIYNTLINLLTPILCVVTSEGVWSCFEVLLSCDSEAPLLKDHCYLSWSNLLPEGHQSHAEEVIVPECHQSGP